MTVENGGPLLEGQHDSAPPPVKSWKYPFYEVVNGAYRREVATLDTASFFKGSIDASKDLYIKPLGQPEMKNGQPVLMGFAKLVKA